MENEYFVSATFLRKRIAVACFDRD